ncbi:MAG: histidine phosphatase family protein [Verrucomicrobiales bacterium]|nr:histidine phosphatase family protein [Verrucomicrobiales bacterium]
MKRLTLVRHAKSGWQSSDLSDFDRPLDPRGLRDAPRMAELLAAENFAPDLIISSPALRAITTAEIFASHLGYDPSTIQHKPDIYEAPPQRIAAVIHTTPDSVNHLAVFGHNPGLQYLAYQLLYRDEIHSLVTCGVIELNILCEHWSQVDHDIAELANYRSPKIFTTP